jgi:Saxitoxin biosynthesis operon protein SxtJ
MYYHNDLQTGIHEDFSRADSVRGSSDRSFGFVFAAVFSLVACLPLLHGKPVRAWAFGISALFLLLALIRPGLLGPANRLWTRLALLLSKITNPIMTGLMFYVVFTPLAIVLHLMGKDLLRLKAEPVADSFWITRSPPGPAPETMRNQF